MKKNITVAVTGLNNIDSPGPGIPVIRALKESTIYNVRIIGLYYENLEPGIYMNDLVDKSYQIPLPSNGIENLKERLNYINLKENINVLIPNFDAELHNFIKIQNELKENFKINTFLPSLELFNSRQKYVLDEFCNLYNINTPKTKRILSLNELYNIEDFKYPIVIKGKYYDAYIAYTLEQAVGYFNQISLKWGTPIVIQEYIKGMEINVTAIGDGNKNCIGAVSMRKLYITDKGKAWSGISINDEKLLEISKNLIQNCNWKGGCELEFIKTSKSEYYLIEMNPRFPAWIYLAVACGQNHPEYLVSLALGNKVKSINKFEIGKLFVRYSFDKIVNLDQFNKASSLREL